MRYSIPYRDYPFEPGFGTPTATANFCEEDFVVSAWIGEFANTLTNLAYVLYAVRGLRRDQHGSRAMYVGLVLVGICSGLFHGLLKYWAQTSDNLSMIIASATVLQQAVTYGRTKAFNWKFTSVLVASVIVESLYSASTDERIVHELSFLLLIASVAFRTRQLVKERVGDEQDRRTLGKVIGLGAGSMVFGYVLWQLDFRYCSELTRLKRAVGMPWSFVFEFHGWWHILTAVGAYTFMALVESLTQGQVIVSSRPFGWIIGNTDDEKRK